LPDADTLRSLDAACILPEGETQAQVKNPNPNRASGGFGFQGSGFA
jgi:hypothetical protein